MASTYVNNLRLNEMATGDGTGTWGTTTNKNLELIADAFGYGTRVIADASTDIITMGDGVSDADRSMYLKLTGGGQVCTVSLLPATSSKVWIMENATSYALTFTCGTGANVAILAGDIKMIATDGGGGDGIVYDVLTDVSLAGTTKVVALIASGAITGSSTIQGTTITATTAFVPDASDGAALGTSSLEFSDLFLADEAVVSFGDGDDVTLTHVHDTGLLLNSTMAIQFNDASQYINAPSNAILDINATDEIELNATAVDLNGTLDVSGTSTLTGAVTASGGITSTAASNTLGATSFNDAAITNVGDIALDSVSSDGSTAPLFKGTGSSGATAIGNAVDNAGLFINSKTGTGAGMAIGVTSGGDPYLQGCFSDNTGGKSIILNPYGDNVQVTGALSVSGTSTLTGNVTMAGDLAVDGTANLDEVDIDGAVQVDSTITVGADDTGYDVKFFGATASAYMLWDESADDLILAGAAGLNVDGTTDLDNTDIDGTLVVDGSNISLDSTSTLNIDNSNTSNGITIGTATSGVPVSIGHTTSEVTVNDNLTVTGTLTLGSGAELTEAELEMLDGITAGTVTASKAVVVDSNKDISTFRNLTIDGVFTDGNYTFDTSGNVSGLGTVGSGAITSSGVVTGTGFTIGSAAINEAELETIDGVTAGTVSASKAVVVDGNKDIASFRNVTLTGELDAGSLDVSGNADIDGTLETDALSINGTTVSSTATELNILDGVTSTTAELNILDGVTSTAAELNILDGVTSTAAELNILDGATVVVGEVNYLDLGSTAVGTAIASKAVVLDSNKDYTGIRNLTATTFIGALTGNASGSSASCTGNAATATLAADATTLATPRAINGVNFDGSAAITITATAAAGTLSGGTLASGVTASSLTSLGTLTSVAISGDATVGDDLSLISDAAVLNFGENSDVSLTHVHDTGLLLNSTRQLQFGDNGSYIQQSADGTMRINGEGVLDLYGSSMIAMSNDVRLNSDASVLGFGVDNEVTLTHVHDTGLLLNSTMALQFNDASQYINAPSNAILDITATDEIELNATAVDLNGTLDVSGTALVTGVLTTTATQVANGGITSGDDIISDTDGTDSLGSTGVRWLKGWFDTLTAGTLTIGSGSVTDSSGAISFGNEKSYYYRNRYCGWNLSIHQFRHLWRR